MAVIDEPFLLEDFEAGCWESFDDPLLEATALRIRLATSELDGVQLRALSSRLACSVQHLAARRLPEARFAVVESDRIFPIAGAAPASVLLRIDRQWVPCGRCAWRCGGCDAWFVDRLAESFVAGGERLGTVIDPVRAKRYVTGELAAEPDWQWWSHLDGGRSGVVVSVGHEDPDGRLFAQCVDAVGRHSTHFSCLASRLRSELECEIRGEVTVGIDWSRERAVVRRLHDQGWRLRGLTSVFPIGNERR